MKKTSTLSNDNNLFYKKSRGLLEVALWMQEQDQGVSINDMMETLKVSRRTAIRIKDSIKNWFPQIQVYLHCCRGDIRCHRSPQHAPSSSSGER